MRNLASKGCDFIINYATVTSNSAATTLARELEQSHSIRTLALRADIFIVDGVRKAHFDCEKAFYEFPEVPYHSKLLLTMTRVWARELAENATVNAINPSPAMTDMYLFAPDEVKQGLSRWNPLTPSVAVRENDSEEAKELGKKFGGRAAYAKEIASLIATICDSEFGWCIGSIISANGGLSFSI